ncbi:cohesin domain-containing protein [Patescibacteria group bacterium]|nr:cohesin domain-containing protein [Patescibacteria group bacterium]MBU4347429.1 cohesin domain-containing protein [Patescibacteria group bacterium]
MTKIQKLKIVLIACILSLIAVPVLAAEVSFDTKTQEIRAGQLFEVGVFINTDNEEINAIEGKIIFPQDLLKIKKINDGNSIINFWIDPVRNCVSNGVKKPNEICFSGITPGGYNDIQGLIFSITFLAKKGGNGAIEFTGVKVLRNDGKGTEAPLTISNFQFLIFNPPTGGPVPQITAPKTEDRNPPEEFTPQIAADPTVFNGKWFLVFATQDKGSGVDHYEVCEGKRKCVITESPYLLQNQDLDEAIVVKAIDKNGNERVATIPAQKSRAWYKNYSLPVILIITAIALAYLIWKILWKRLNTK